MPDDHESGFLGIGTRALTPAQRRHLIDGGLTEQTIADARLFSIDRDGPKWGLAKSARGIAFSYPHTEVCVGGRRKNLVRVRIDEDARGKRGAKYLSPSKKSLERGSPQGVYYPPDVYDLRKQTDTPVWITEGEKKSLVLTQHGHPCLALAGVWMFTDPADQNRNRSKKRLHPMLRDWRWRGRVVYVCFDADQLDNDSVTAAQDRLCVLLAAEGAIVMVIALEEGPGIDDYVVKYGPEAIPRLADAAEAWVPGGATIRRIDPLAPVATQWAQVASVAKQSRRQPESIRRELVERLANRLTLDPQELRRRFRVGEQRGLPEIVTNNRQDIDVIDDAWAALTASDYSSTMFLHGGRLVDIKRDEPGAAKIATVSPTLLTARLRRVACWRMERGEDELVDASVPRDIAADMLAMPSEDVKVLDRIVHIPCFDPSGQLLETDGFHDDSGLFLDLPPELRQLPSHMDSAGARELLTDVLLADFPFVDPSDLAHAVAALILPFLRPMISGPTPLHLIEAPVEGTGKTLLAHVFVLIATGHELQPIAVPKSGDALAKKITAVLRQAPTAIVLDNLPPGPLDNEALASTLTSTVCQDRQLGESKMLSLENKAAWIATGNNPSLSRELARRTIRIRMDAGSAEPWRRRNFRHPDLIAWVHARRSTLVAAVLALVRHWLDAGMPVAPARLGSFERWSRVVGGVLEHNGFDGFLQTPADTGFVDVEDLEWQQVLLAMADDRSSEAFGAKELLALGRQLDLSIAAPEATERATKARFGRALATRANRVYGDRKLVAHMDAGKKQRVYRLVPTTAADHP